MTTIIHPKDSSTDFLKEIYRWMECVVINENKSKGFIRKSIRNSDTVMIMGHGSEFGLYGFNKILIDSTFVQELRFVENLILIWCNADKFVKKYSLKPKIYTGMVISEVDEAYDYGFYSCTHSQIEESNKLFSLGIKSILYGESNNPMFDLNDNVINNFNRNTIHRNL